MSKSFSCPCLTEWMPVVMSVAISTGWLITDARGQTDATASQKPGRNRLVRVVTVSQDGLSEKPGKAMLEATLARLEQASVFQPDIACLPEHFTGSDPEALPSPTAERLGDWARKHDCYVICPVHLRDGDRVYNSALLIDRKGQVIGRYDKMRPTEQERLEEWNHD